MWDGRGFRNPLPPLVTLGHVNTWTLHMKYCLICSLNHRWRWTQDPHSTFFQFHFAPCGEKLPFLSTLNLTSLFPLIPPRADTEKFLWQAPKNGKIILLLHPLPFDSLFFCSKLSFFPAFPLLHCLLNTSSFLLPRSGFSTVYLHLQRLMPKSKIRYSNRSQAQCCMRKKTSLPQVLSKKLLYTGE